MDKVTIKIQMIARMACALGKCIEDGCDEVTSFTGCVESGYAPAMFCEDKSCKVVVGLTAPAIAALIKPPIQVNGTTNPVLIVDQDGQIIRCHGEVDALLAHLDHLAKNVLLRSSTISAMEQAQMQADKIKELLEDDTIFIHGCCGYWAGAIIHNGVSPSAELGWLLTVFDQGDGLDHDLEAITAFKDGQKLPPGYYKLGPDEAKKIVDRGIEKHGIDFVDGTCDLSDLDNVVQEVLLGEVVYG